MWLTLIAGGGSDVSSRRPAISLRSKPPSNPAQDCTYRFKRKALRHGSHDGASDAGKAGEVCRAFGDL
jgi:hypothetical protein